MAQKNEEDDKVRLDKWLWAARFYKTRALAKAAIESGKVHCRGERCKPGKEPRIGDEFVIRTGFEERTVVVQALSIVRRGAPEAQTLYAETEASILQAVSDYQQHGFCYSLGRWNPEVYAVGVPLSVTDGSGTLALSLSGPVFNMNKTRLIDELGPRLLALRDRLQSSFGAGR